MIQCFCNNLGVITNMSNLQNKTVKWPNNATNDNQEVYLAILQATQQYNPLQVSFTHVLGHQDKDPKQKLTTIEQFNVKCNWQAKQYVCATPLISTSISNPKNPNSIPPYQHQWENHLPKISDGSTQCSCNTSLFQLISVQNYNG